MGLILKFLFCILRSAKLSLKSLHTYSDFILNFHFHQNKNSGSEQGMQNRIFSVFYESCASLGPSF